jgi:uncharacterized membrane protein YdjX (TVP38/TMEM64 family)
MSRLVRKRWIAVLVLAIFLGLFSAGFRFSLFFELFSMNRIIEWVELAKSNQWFVALFYVFYVVGVMALPITLFPIIGGVLANFWIALPLNLAATTIGGWLSFRVGRAVGRETIEPWLKGNLKAMDRLAASKGLGTVLLLRIVGIPPYAVANYGLGLSAIRNRDFILGTAIGIFPWMTLITYMSTSLWQAVLQGGEKGLASALMRAGAPLSVFSASILVMVGISWWIKRRRHRRAHAHHSNL